MSAITDKPPVTSGSAGRGAPHLWYVVPAANLTSGHAQASEKDTTRVAPAGTAVDAATAAPTEDPGFDAAVDALQAPAWPNEPCCCSKHVRRVERQRFRGQQFRVQGWMDGWMDGNVCTFLISFHMSVAVNWPELDAPIMKDGQTLTRTSSVSWDAIANVTGGCPPAVLHWRQCHLSTGIYRSASGG